MQQCMGIFFFPPRLSPRPPKGGCFSIWFFAALLLS